MWTLLSTSKLSSHEPSVGSLRLTTGKHRHSIQTISENAKEMHQPLAASQNPCAHHWIAYESTVTALNLGRTTTTLKSFNSLLHANPPQPQYQWTLVSVVTCLYSCIIFQVECRPPRAVSWGRSSGSWVLLQQSSTSDFCLCEEEVGIGVLKPGCLVVDPKDRICPSDVWAKRKGRTKR